MSGKRLTSDLNINSSCPAKTYTLYAVDYSPVYVILKCKAANILT